MKDIKAIPTTLHGMTYKSRLEARWALFLTLSGIQFWYEPNGPDTLPDLSIAHTSTVGKVTQITYTLIEIKGQMPNKEYITWLRQQGVHYIAISGFFKGLRPLMFYIQEKRGKLGLFAEHFSDVFPGTSTAFIKACNYRFDL
jgi:hypothetical protein